jgi:hypothetical protein
MNLCDTVGMMRMKNLPLFLASIISLNHSLAAGASDLDPFVTSDVPHPGSDQIFWAPTFAQAEEAARETGRMILVMGSVGDWNGY